MLLFTHYNGSTIHSGFWAQRDTFSAIRDEIEKVEILCNNEPFGLLEYNLSGPVVHLHRLIAQADIKMKSRLFKIGFTIGIYKTLGLWMNEVMVLKYYK